MEGTKKSSIRKIVQQYGVKAEHIETYGKTYKITSNKGNFALKKISPQAGIDFVRNVQWLYQRGYNRIVPIYPTLDGRYAILHDQYLFYLMPWLSNEEKEDRFEKHQKMFRELARLHTLSMKDIQITSEQREEHYENTVEQWEREEEFFEEFLEQSEKKWYMSPFELLYCTFYQDIFQSLEFARKKLDQWYEASKDTTKGRTVVVHGKLSTEHFLYDDRGYGYFTNFENSKISSPIQDLLPFLSRTLKAYPKRFDDCVDWLYTYFGHFPLREDEKHLFLSYLAHPGPIARTVEDYYLKKTNRNEVKFVRKLQRQYWLLKNTEYVVSKINEIEQQKNQTESDGPS